MADNDNNGEQTTSRGADWEVVQLTASAYAAVPGPNEAVSTNDNKEAVKAAGHGQSSAVFMSNHFVFPPSEHENLPIALDVDETREPEPLSTDWDGDTGSRNDDVGLWSASGDDPYRVELYEGGGAVGFVAHTGSEDARGVDTDEADTGETLEFPEKHVKSGEEVKLEGSDLPCEAWWKRRTTSAYRRAKEGNTLLSIIVAATVVGLVVLGHRWQREKWQFLQHRFSVADERMRTILSRYK